MIYIGIDPGVSGGIALLDDDGAVVDAVVMPATERDLYDYLCTWPASRLPMSGFGPWRAMLEKAQTMPKQGIVSAFTYGRGYGALRMALTAADIPFDEVTSPVWQAALQCRSRGQKNITKARAQQLFPKVKVTHAIADALLIAEYGRRRERGSSGKETEGAAPQRASGQSGSEGRRPDQPSDNPLSQAYREGLEIAGALARATQSGAAGDAQGAESAPRQPVRGARRAARH